MSDRTVRFMRSIADQFPAFEKLLEEHRSDFGEILPHLAIADLERHAESLFLAGESGREELRAILVLLEEAFCSGDDELQELISVSFLEHLPRPGEPVAGIRDLVGPAMSEQLEIIG